MKKNYPPNFIDLCIASCLIKLYTPKVIVQNVPKRNGEVFRFKFERSFKNYLAMN